MNKNKNNKEMKRNTFMFIISPFSSNINLMRKKIKFKYMKRGLML